MKIKPFGFIGWIADTVVLILIIVGLCITWLKPEDDDLLPGLKSFKINHYGKVGLRHTCKMGSDSFNEGCLVYQGSVITIILCATGLFTIAFSALYSLLNFCAGDKLNDDADGADADVSKYIIKVAVTHLALFFQLLIAVIAYVIGSHRVREDFKYKFSAGWILLLVSTIITFCVSAMFFVAQCFISKTIGILALLARAVSSLIPTGSFLIIAGLCTSFYVNTVSRVNALKVKAATGLLPPMKKDLKDFCSGSDKDAHKCALYRSSATIIAFTVFGLLCCGVANDKSPKKFKIVSSLPGFMFLAVGFIQYAAVGEKVKKDENMGYGLGWIFYLCGVCLNGLGTLFTILVAVFLGDKLDLK